MLVRSANDQVARGSKGDGYVPLPAALVAHIASWLEQAERVAVARCCKVWAAGVRSPLAWVPGVTVRSLDAALLETLETLRPVHLCVAGHLDLVSEASAPRWPRLLAALERLHTLRIERHGVLERSHLLALASACPALRALQLELTARPDTLGHNAAAALMVGAVIQACLTSLQLTTLVLDVTYPAASAVVMPVHALAHCHTLRWLSVAGPLARSLATVRGFPPALLGLRIVGGGGRRLAFLECPTKQLRLLVLESCDTFEAPPDVSAWVTLEHVVLIGTLVKDAEWFARLPRLRRYTSAFTRVGPDLLRRLVQLASLTTLELPASSLGASTLAELRRCRAPLMALDLSNPPCCSPDTANAPSLWTLEGHLAQLSGLRTLGVAHTAIASNTRVVTALRTRGVDVRCGGSLPLLTSDPSLLAATMHALAERYFADAQRAVFSLG